MKKKRKAARQTKLLVIVSSKMDVHEVAVAESLSAVGTLARAIDESILNTPIAENVTTGFDDSVFDLVLTNLALQHGLSGC